MTATPRLRDYLDHIDRAGQDALAFVEGLSLEDFQRDRRTQQAVIMSLIIIGEAATKIMDGHEGFTKDHPDIPWKSMRNMRNRMAHGYFDTDLVIVWHTVKDWLPALLVQLRGIAPDARAG